MNLAPVAARCSVIAVSALTSCLCMCTNMAYAQDTDASFQGLGFPSGAFLLFPRDMSDDGAVIVGSGFTPAIGWRWTEQSGFQVLNFVVEGTNGDGSLVVGFNNTTNNPVYWQDGIAHALPELPGGATPVWPFGGRPPAGCRC